MKKIILVLLVLTMIFTLAACGKKDKETTSDKTTTKPGGNQTTAPAEQTTAPQQTTTDEPEETRNIPTEMKSGTLILVNDTYTYSAKDTKNLVKLIEKKNNAYSLATDAYKLQAEVVEAMNRMFADFKEATGEGYTCITSAYKDGVKGDLATGLSFAIKVYAEDKLTYEINDPKYKENYKWLSDNCHKYGFILRYPNGKKSETGKDAQVNYFRYVGVPHSTYIYANNLSLEAYLQKLKTDHTGFDKALEVSLVEGVTYKIYYSSEKKDPNKEEYAFAWSGTNVDGYIITLTPKETNNEGENTEG